VNVVTKSGTNAIHGSLYYYNRNEAFGDPSPFFAPRRAFEGAPERNENYGFSAVVPSSRTRPSILPVTKKQQFILWPFGYSHRALGAWVTKAKAALTEINVKPSAASATAVGPTGFLAAKHHRQPALQLRITSSVQRRKPDTATMEWQGLDQEITSKHHLYLRVYGGQGNQIAPLGEPRPGNGQLEPRILLRGRSYPVFQLFLLC